MNPAGEEINRLKEAVHSVEVPPFLEARIRNRIRVEKLPRTWLPGLVTATVATAILGGVLIAYQFGHLRLTVGAQES